MCCSESTLPPPSMSPASPHISGPGRRSCPLPFYSVGKASLPDGNDEVINNALFRVAISSSAGANGIRVNRIHPDKPAPPTLDDRLVIARLLLESEREVHAIARGWSMSPTIPSGATLRIERATADSLVVGDVIAFAVNQTLVTHRIVS